MEISQAKMSLLRLIFLLVLAQKCAFQTTEAPLKLNVTSPPLTSAVTQTTPIKTTAAVVSSTESPESLCARHNTSCDDCIGVEGAKCLYCKSDGSCKPYPLSKVLPGKDVCALDQARWGVCWLNFEALIISVSVIGGSIILFIVSCCIYCCCCRGGGSKKKYDKEDARYEAQKMERNAKAEERRAERKVRLDEIRRKYGLMKDDAPYQRFDA